MYRINLVFRNLITLSVKEALSLALVKLFQKTFKSNAHVDDDVLDLNKHEEILVDLTELRQQMLGLIEKAKAAKLKFEAKSDVRQIADVLQDLGDIIARNTEGLVTIDAHAAALKDYRDKLIRGAPSEELASSKDAFYESLKKITQLDEEPQTMSHHTKLM